MPPRATVLDVSALLNYRADLARFQGDANEMIDRVSYQLRREAEWMLNVVHQRQAALSRARTSLEQAIRALENCLAAQNESGGPDCSGCAAEVSYRRQDVVAAEEDLSVAKRCTQEFDEARCSYERSELQFNRLLMTNLPASMVVLDRFGRALEGYRVVAIPSSSGTSTGVTDSAPIAVIPTAPSSASATISFPALGTADVVEVPISLVDFTDSTVSGPQSYRKVSYAEMRRGFFALEEVVLPEVRNGASGDHFSAIDAKRGLSYHDGFRRVFDSFFGDESIRLDAAGDHFSVTNGYHRLHIARELGIKTVPARVTGQIHDSR